jgi:ATP-dependent Clp protease protease subunit
MSERNPSSGLRARSGPPEEFPWPGGPSVPGPSVPGRRPPGRPSRPGEPPVPGPPGPEPVPATRVWLDPHAGWQDTLAERLLKQRIVLASGVLDDPAATRLSAHLLTLDAEGGRPIRLELQNLQAELPAVLTLMGVLDVMRAEVRAFASGETGGPALGVLASCPRRLAYRNASFTLSEPRLRFGGTVTAVTAQEQQANRMTDALFYRIAEATGRNAEDIRDDARRCRAFTVAEAIGYGLIHERAARRPA